MLGLASPYWLSALILIPIIWWLHKLHPYGNKAVVSSLLYWQFYADNQIPAKHGRQNHPLWLLRALITLLIILSLAGPFWFKDTLQRVDIWVDGSFSMNTLENGKNRKAQAIESIVTKLKTLNNAHAEIHSLSKPDYPALSLKSETESSWQTHLNEWYKIVTHPSQLPLPIQFSTENENWLVTDGADLTTNRWLKTIPINRVIQVGQKTENSAISLFSIRPGLKKTGVWQGLIQLQHFGEHPTQRSIELLSSGSRLKQWSVNLKPQQFHYIDFNIDHASITKQVLTTRFVNPDTLAADDQLSIQLDTHKTVKITGSCPSALLAAIQSHPTLAVSKINSNKTDFTILCGGKRLSTSAPSIQFYLSQQPEKLDTNPVWQPLVGSLNTLFLQKDWLRYSGNSQIKKDGKAILATAKTTLITLIELTNRRIDCFIDINDPLFISRPEYPVFIADLIDLVLRAEILNNIQSSKRDAIQSQIKRLAVLQPTVKPGKTDYSSATDLTTLFIAVALILLLLDYFISISYFQQ